MREMTLDIKLWDIMNIIGQEDDRIVLGCNWKYRGRSVVSCPYTF